MAKYPHYSNSTAAMNNWEVAHLNLFEISIQPPSALPNWNTSLLMEQVIKVSGLDVDKVPPSGIVQTYKGWSRTYAEAKLPQTYVDIVVDFEVNLNDANSMYMYKGLKEWCRRLFDPQTAQMSLKADYAGGPFIVSVFNRPGDIYRQYTFPTVWPTANINAMDLDYTASEIFRITGFTFRADYFKDVSN